MGVGRSVFADPSRRCVDVRWYAAMTALSIVPARLGYACGHAALVLLPRVKGESPRQRNERVNNEKAAAGQRSCDFCAPSTQPIVGANDLVAVGGVASAQA